MSTEEPSLLRIGAEAGYVRAMYELGLESTDLQERRHWLRQAAGEGYVPAMCAFAMECDDIDQRKRWLTEAAANGWQAAIEVLEGLEQAAPCS